MTRRRTKTTRFCLLVLALLTGQIQAQSVFLCAMMDEVIRGECCCTTNRAADHRGGSGYDLATSEPSERCCDHLVELSFQPDAEDERPITRSHELRAGVDPPPAIARWGLPNTLLLTRSTPAAPFLPSHAHLIRSDTYLLTQRLRI